LEKDTAIKILKTNIHRELCKKWAFVAIIIIINCTLVSYFIIFNPLNIPFLPLEFEKSSIKIENIIPSIFSSSVTVSSILLGFFSVSTFNFYNRDQKVMDLCNDLLPKKYAELQIEIEESQILDGQNNNRSIELKNSIELLELNHDASAHSQEHSLKFMKTFFIVTISSLIVDFYAFLYSGIKRFDAFFIMYAIFFLIFIYYGLTIYLNWFMSSTKHKEMY
jgi:hypothetical protein